MGERDTAGKRNVIAIRRLVEYMLTEEDAKGITKKRATHNASQADDGTPVKAGLVFPMLITKVKGPVQVEVTDKDGTISHEERVAVSGQVFLEGNDVWWVKSTTEGDKAGEFSFETR